MIASVKESVLEFYSFLKNPIDKADPEQRFSHKFKQLFILFALDLALVTLLVMPIFYVIEQTGWVNFENHTAQKSMEKEEVWYILLSVVIIAPILEELLFRTFITFKRNYPLRFVIALAGFGGIRNKAKVSGYVKGMWRRCYLGLFYFVAAGFAFVHLNNYELTTSVWLLSPLLVLPQFLAGLTIGYIRVKHGLGWGMLLHGFNNFILTTISLWFIYQAEEKLSLKTEAYEIKIEESAVRGSKNSKVTDGGILFFERVALENILPRLVKKEKKFIKMEDSAEADQLLNIQFTPFSDTLNKEQIILKHLQEIYHFKIRKENSHSQFYELALTDSLLLQKHQCRLPETEKYFKTNIIFSPEGLSMENANTDHLLQNLNKTYDQLIVSENPLPGHYNFFIPPTKFEDLNQFFQQNYGLSLIHKEKDFEYVLVEF